MLCSIFRRRQESQNLIQSGFESLVCLLDFKRQFSGLILIQLLCGTHLVESDEPLDDFPTILEVLVCDFIDRLYYFR